MGLDWQPPSNTTAFRCIDGATDGYPGLVAEVFGRVGIFSLFHPQCKLEEAVLVGLAEECAKTFGLQGIYRKDLGVDRSNAGDPRQHHDPTPWWGNGVGEAVKATEYGVSFWVWPFDGFHVGWFVDQRENRRQLREDHPRGGTLLNLFCYTGAFSLGPAVDGAITTNVDLSQKTLGKLQANLQLNGVDPTPHRFFAEDCVKFLGRARRRGDSFRTIVLDPPTFSRSKKAVFRVADHLAPMVEDCFALLEPGGELWVSTNSHQWSPGEFESRVEKAIPQANRLPSLPPGVDCAGSAEVKSLRLKKS